MCIRVSRGFSFGENPPIDHRRQQECLVSTHLPLPGLKFISYNGPLLSIRKQNYFQARKEIEVCTLYLYSNSRFSQASSVYTHWDNESMLAIAVGIHGHEWEGIAVPVHAEELLRSNRRLHSENVGSANYLVGSAWALVVQAEPQWEPVLEFDCCWPPTEMCVPECENNTASGVLSLAYQITALQQEDSLILFLHYKSCLCRRHRPEKIHFDNGEKKEREHPGCEVKFANNPKCFSIIWKYDWSSVGIISLTGVFISACILKFDCSQLVGVNGPLF